LRQQQDRRAGSTLAKDTTMRDHAAMARRQLRTRDYPDDARKRLGKEVERARRAAGYRYRTDFCRSHGIKNLRGLEMLESGQPGVGQAFLFEIARALPGWTEETPQVVLDGGEPPPLSDRAVEPGRSPAQPTGLSDAERRVIRALSAKGWVPEDIAEVIDELRRSNAALPSVEQPSETDRERNAIFRDRSSDTRTG
jgi:hypothetical protein